METFGTFVIMLLAALCAVAGESAAFHSKRLPGAEGKGIWKSAVPTAPMHGEFANHDPIGLANRQFIKADCSLNWRDPDDGKLYCFSTPTSLAYFLYWPKANSRRAQSFWQENAPSQ